MPSTPDPTAATCPGCGQTERWCRCQPPDDDDGVWVDENGPVDAAATKFRRAYKWLLGCGEGR